MSVNLNIDYIITSDKILNFINKLKNSKIVYIKTDFIKNRNNNIVTINNWRNMNTIINLKTIEILVTGHSAYPIGHEELDILNYPNLKLWICQNKNIEHPKLKSIPIGITNKDEPNSIIHKIIGNTDVIYKILKQPKNTKNLAYLNITASTFSSERENIINLYKNKSWVTYEGINKSIDGHKNFIKQIYNHKFIFAPRGVGIDTHRLWESLYLNSIPIVKKHIGMEEFYDLPILFVDNWDNITEEYLNNKYYEINCKSFILDKINIEYWYKFIKHIN